MIVFETEEDLEKYVSKKISTTLKDLTKWRSTSLRRKSTQWEGWEDTYLVDNYRLHAINVVASVLNRTPSSVSQRLNKLRKIYGLPYKFNKNGKVFTFKL